MTPKVLAQQPPWPTMKIGKLPERTAIPTRMLRYYEEQGLLRSGRDDNGYRSYLSAAGSLPTNREART